MAGFIDVVKKVVTDPDIIKEGVELGVRALTMPDPDESTGDFRKSAFVTGQISQSMADREEAKRREALQAEAERQRQAKIEERVFEAKKLIAGKEMDAAIKGKEMEMSSILDTRKNRRSEWQNVLKDEKVVPSAYGFELKDQTLRDALGLANGEIFYAPTEYSTNMFMEADLFNFNSKDAMKRRQGLIAFSKAMAGIFNRHKIYKAGLNSKGSKGSSRGKVYIDGVTGLRAREYVPELMNFELHLVDSSTIPSVGNGQTRVGNEAQSHSTKILQAVVGIHSKLIANPAITPQTAMEFGYDPTKWKDLQEKYKNLATLRHELMNGDKPNYSLQEYANELYDAIVAVGDKDRLDASLRQALLPKVSSAPNTSSNPMLTGKPMNVTDTDLAFYQKNPVLALMALRAKVITDDDLKQLNDEIKRRGGSNIASAETKSGNQIEVAGQRTSQVVLLASSMTVFDDVLDDLMKDPSISQEAKTKLKALDDRINSTYHDATSSQKRQMFFEMRDAMTAADPDGNILGNRINPYIDALNYIAVGVPKETIQRSGLKVKRSVVQRLGVSLVDKSGEPTTQARNIDSAIQANDKLMDAVDRIRITAQRSRKDFSVSGGSQLEDSQINLFGGAAGDVNKVVGFFKYAKELVSGLTQVVTGDGQDGYEEFIASTQSGSLFEEQKRIGADSFKEKYGYVIDVSAVNNTLSKHKEKMLKGFKIIDGQYRSVINNPRATQEQKEQAKDVYLRRAALMWEKTAITYQLAGLVQGEQTGGRTISNQDFDNIYAALWGGRFFSEESALNAVRLLNFVTNHTQMKLQAQRHALTTLGTTGQTIPLVNNYFREIYARNFKRFTNGKHFNSDEEFRQFYNEAKREIKQSDGFVLSDRMVRANAFGQDTEVDNQFEGSESRISGLSNAGLDGYSLNQLYKFMTPIFNYTRDENRGGSTEESSKDAYVAFEDLFDIAQEANPAKNSVTNTLDTLYDNITTLQKTINANKNKGQFQRAGIILSTYNDEGLSSFSNFYQQLVVIGNYFKEEADKVDDEDRIEVLRKISTSDIIQRLEEKGLRSDSVKFFTADDDDENFLTKIKAKYAIVRE